MADDAVRRLALGRALLGQRLREARSRLGLQLRDVATGAGISKSYLSDIERGRRLPNLDVLDALACTLGTTVTQLLTDLYPWDSTVEPEEVDVLRDGRRRPRESFPN